MAIAILQRHNARKYRSIDSFCSSNAELICSFSSGIAVNPSRMQTQPSSPLAPKSPPRQDTPLDRAGGSVATAVEIHRRSPPAGVHIGLDRMHASARIAIEAASALHGQVLPLGHWC